MKSTGLATLIIILISCAGHAARKTEWSLHLDSKLEAQYFPEEYGEDTNTTLTRLELIPVYRWKYLESWRLHLKPVFVADPANKSEEERTFFDPAEAYLRYQSDSYSLQAGYNIFTWGVTDGYNPLDIINTRQYFDPLHARKLGAPSLTFSQGLGRWEYDLVYIPRSRESILPGENSRWLPREIYIPQTADNDLVLLLPENLRYSFSDRQDFGSPLDNNYALRLQYRGDWIDFSLSAYEGVSSFPYVEPVVTGTIVQVSPKTVIQVDPDVVLNTYNYRIQQAGLAVVTNQQNFLFKAVGSYTKSLEDNPNIQNWVNENVVGVEKTFNLGSDGMMIAILQYSFINTERKNDSNLSITEIFRSAYMGGGRITWREVWGFNFMGLYDSLRGSTFQEYSMNRRLYDKWLVTLSANFIQGSSDTPLGLYDKNDSYTLSLSRSF